MASANFAKVKNYYKKKLWSLARVKAAVGKWITKAEYKEITGEVYPEQSSEQTT